MEVDIPYDYSADVQLDVVSHFNQTGLVSPPHPICLDEALAPVAEEALARIAARLDILRPSACDVVAEEMARCEPEGHRCSSRMSGRATVTSLTAPSRTRRATEATTPLGCSAGLLPRIVGQAKKRQAGELGRGPDSSSVIHRDGDGGDLEDPRGRRLPHASPTRTRAADEEEELRRDRPRRTARLVEKELKLRLPIQDDAHAEALDALFGPFPDTHRVVAGALTCQVWLRPGGGLRWPAHRLNRSDPRRSDRRARAGQATVSPEPLSRVPR